ncbi:MAG: IS200/IS605 family transposase [Bacteroidales bacterium]|nr:IS200/IS605 family transposase [Bacteroidales bacterium]
MSYTSTMYHIIVRTHSSERTISEEHERDLYAYVMGIVDEVGGKLYRIGGMPDHIHLFLSLPANLSMSDFVQRMKTATSKWLKANPVFPHWSGWSKEYAGFSYSAKEKDRVANYIRNQKEHHKHTSFAEEYRAFLEENGLTVDERYFLKD